MCTTNDSNGNARRCYVLIQDGEPLGVWDEGCEGIQSVPVKVRTQCPNVLRIAVTPGEYRDWLRVGRECREAMAAD
jgi:hypothetical protein